MTEPVLGGEARRLRVAVVGSGPSAFYAVEALFKSRDPNVRVDVFERLPTPYGLVRGGVAPDHQSIKAVVKAYDRVAAHPGFRFFGNVTVGRDLHVDDLRTHYDQIVYAVGNETDRKMGIEGEDLCGVHSATEFVGWYNGHPDFRDREFDLSRAERVVVVGNGNVAMDVTRVLAKSADALAETDIADHAIDALRKSRVREIVLLGRRGPAQAAFSPKEIQEIAEIEGADLVVEPEQVELDEVSRRWLEERGDRAAQKNVRFLTEQARAGEGASPRKVRCRFLVSPVRVLGSEGRMTGVRIQHAELLLDDTGTPRPRGLERFEEIEAQLLFKAIGYRGVAIEGVPFDDRRGTIPNAEGRVLTAAGGEVVPGEYVVGWAKRGPTGLIGTNGPDSRATVRSMVADLAGARAAPLPEGEEQAIVELLRRRGVDFVSYRDWQALDAWEIAQGAAAGRVRRKLCSVEEMMSVIHDLRAAQEEASPRGASRR